MELEYPDGTTTLQHGDAIVATGGVTAWDGASGLLLEDSEIRDSVRAGVLIDGSSALLTGNSFTDNTVDVIWQDCDGVDEPFGLGQVPVVDHCPLYNHHIVPLEFSLYLEDGEPLDWEAAVRSATTPSPLPSMPTEPPLPFLKPLPSIPMPTTKLLPKAPIQHNVSFFPSEPRTGAP